MHILLAEDHKDLRGIVVSYLRSLGHKVTETKDGRELLDHLKSVPLGTFDAIVTDNNMPELKGIEALKLLKRSEEYVNFKDIPVILYSMDYNIEKLVKELGGIFVDKFEMEQIPIILGKLQEGTTT